MVDMIMYGVAEFLVLGYAVMALFAVIVYRAATK